MEGMVARNALFPPRRFVARHGWGFLGLPLVLATMVIYFSSQSSNFLTESNFENVSRNIGPIALLALAEGFVILLGQIDISVGAVVGLATVVTAYVVGELGALGLLAAPATGAVVGLVNGTIVARFHVHAVIVTIATMTAVQGIAFSVSNGRPVSVELPSWFSWLAYGQIGPFAAPLVISVGVFVIAILLVRYTRFGPMLYSTGGNEEAARLAGLPVFRIKLAAFILAGTLAGIAALIFSARTETGQANIGQGLELDAIAAAVVGGMALVGGKGSIPGVAMGVLVLAVLQNGLDITNVSSFSQQIVIGIVILIAIIVDRLRDQATDLEAPMDHTRLVDDQRSAQGAGW